jgi:hypothetical protein
MSRETPKARSSRSKTKPNVTSYPSVMAEVRKLCKTAGVGVEKSQ